MRRPLLATLLTAALLVLPLAPAAPAQGMVGGAYGTSPSGINLLGNQFGGAGGVPSISSQNVGGLIAMVLGLAMSLIQMSNNSNPGMGTNAGVIDVFTSLNFRQGPGQQYPRNGLLGAGTPVTILQSRNGWLQVMANGQVGWVRQEYVWRPGQPMQNGAIQPDIATQFGQMPGMSQYIPGPRPAPAGFDPNAGTDPAQPSNTAGSRQGQRLSDGGLDIPLFNQNAIGARYPSGFCGPTSIKMALGYYGINKDINYLGLQDVGGATPVYHQGAGAGHQAMLDMVKACGLQGSTMNHGQSIAWLKQQTDAGYPVVVSVRGNYGPRSTAGHILTVAGVTANGDVIVNDSAGGKRVVCPASRFYNAWSSSSRMAIVCKP